MSTPFSPEQITHILIIAIVMVHYIRFLSTPQVAVTSRKSIAISAPLAVTTDLGDTYLHQDVSLLVRLIDVKAAAVIAEQRVLCKGSSRALKTSLECNGKYLGRAVCVHVTTLETQRSIQAREIPQILDVWSHDFTLTDKERSEPLVVRKVSPGTGQVLCIWEETGDSIARHVWDASLGFLIYLQQALEERINPGPKMLKTLLSRNKRLQILELGTGCGTVGIAFAQQFNCHVTLTDLDDAMDILETNVKQASPATQTKLTKATLDWGEDVEASLQQSYDIILLSDCIYNPDSSVALVRTLLDIATSAPQA
ncbi:uncharacterized protein AB675_662 [Cyphellophora attinorum]|uniref:Uncharacterized protein n=1 Tax=Cyphellophora attinorum TaxID=1664694 RepID=A0A0N0NSE0_9EURO|nr:uncharacterized protein AB675_662 [Phialophora attinorum]KPI45899.1 hypothetical protein AB675_662 [Phialophora attinorum]